jgi:hypothetical protein
MSEDDEKEETFMDHIGGFIVLGLMGWGIYSYWGDISDFLFGDGIDRYVTVDGQKQKLDGRDSLYDFAPRNQKYFSAFISKTKSQIDENTSGPKKKKIWINASRKLCSDNTFGPFRRKVGWIGYVEKVRMNDRGEMNMDVEFDVHSNEVRQSNIPKRFENVFLELSEGDIVKFSGKFQKGNMSENECLNGGLDSNPELTDEPYDFTLSSLEKLTIIEVATEE